MIGKSVKFPYLRLFPIWKYGPRYDVIDGRYVDDGWYPERYGEHIVPLLTTPEVTLRYADLMERRGFVGEAAWIREHVAANS